MYTHITAQDATSDPAKKLCYYFAQSSKESLYLVLQCVAVCCNVLQCVATCYSVLQRVAVCCSVVQCVAVCCSVLQCGAAWCHMLQCVVLQCVAACCSMLQCVATCYSVLQHVVVCCSFDASIAFMLQCHRSHSLLSLLYVLCQKPINLFLNFF